MKNRNPIFVAVMSFITAFIYSWYWHVSTKNELNKLGGKVPTAWIWLIPFAYYYWLWRYSEAADMVTKGRLIAPLAFLLVLALGPIGDAVVQLEFNKVKAS